MRQVPLPSIPLWWRQANFRDFRRAYAAEFAAREHSSLVLFAGTGLSIHADPRLLKSWGGLLQEMALRHDTRKATGPDGSAPIGLEVASLLADQDDCERFLRAGSTLRRALGDVEWRATLNDLLNNADIRKLSSPLHNELAWVPWRRIVTTNYDCLLELACRREWKEGPDVDVFHPTHGDLNAVEQPTGKAIYKIHGDIDDRSSTIVLAQEEYDELYKGKTPGADGDERGKRVRSTFMLSLATLVRTPKVILFLGYGHNDPYFQELWDFIRQGVKDANAFAMMPVEGTLAEFNQSVRRFAEKGIKVIGYSTDDGYVELRQFVEYLRHFDTREPAYQQAATQQRPSVVMVYCGGTIGAEQPADPRDPLKVNRQHSRFGHQLNEYRDKLLNWYREFHHAGFDVPELDVVWEILPVQHQMFSENATPEHWSVLTGEVGRVIDKYINAPRLIGEEGEGVVPRACEEHLAEDRRQWAEHSRGAPGAPDELSVKRFIDSVSNRYVLGVVLLAGTDTLAYSAAALSLGMQHLPCPVVLTGSSQPPSSTHLPVNQRGRFFTTSDAWRNLMTTLYFLQSFGHTLTEVFVCFAETVHHGVNLRKVATGGIPYARDPAGRRGGEHFTFRNLSYRSHYMFRMIDGLFCNNFYPRDGITFAALVGQDRDEFLDLRHVRHALDTPSAPLKTYGFSGRVWHLKASPCAPVIDVPALSGTGRLPHVVLLEGYTSGTYPSAENSAFLGLMEELDAHGVPFVVTAPYGLRPTGLAYETGPSSRTRRQIVPLAMFSITEETALPLLCRVIDEIERDPAAWAQWENAGDGQNGRAQSRICLLREAIEQFFHQRPNLITEELVGLTDRDKNVGRRDRLAAEARSSERIALNWDPRFGIFEALKDRVRGQVSPARMAPERGGAEAGAPPSAGAGRSRPKGVLLSREGFTAMVDEIVRPYLRVGAAPDGFAVLSNIGFEMGLGIVGTVGDWSRTPYPLKRFRDRGPDQRDALDKAEEVLHSVAAICREAGVAEVTIQPEREAAPRITTSPPLDDWPEGEPAGWLRFAVRLERHDSAHWMHEKYAVVAFSQDDEEFFNLVMTGVPASVDAERAGRAREEAFTDLLLNRWQHNLSGVDWFLLGLWKGVACGIARGLRFDSLAVEGRHLQPGHLRALRQAVRCDILFGNPHAFGLQFTYHAVGELQTPAARPAAQPPAPAVEAEAALNPPEGLAAGTRVQVPEEIAATVIAAKAAADGDAPTPPAPPSEPPPKAPAAEAAPV